MFFPSSELRWNRGMKTINQDCPLCEGEFAEIDAKMHELFDMHKTDGVCWKPERGHPSKEIHDKIIKLLEKLRDTEKDRDKYRRFYRLSWYKRISPNTLGE